MPYCVKSFKSSLKTLVNTKYIALYCRKLIIPLPEFSYFWSAPLNILYHLPIYSDYFCMQRLNSLLKHFNWKLPCLEFLKDYRLFSCPWETYSNLKERIVLLLVVSAVLFISINYLLLCYILFHSCIYV